MLEGLDAVDWKAVEHAYGPADDVPGLIRQLASSDGERRDKAMWHLYGNIWHQGTVYEATAFAVPFLIELLDSPTVQDKHEILDLLAHLANGNSYHDVHQHYSWYDDKRDMPEFKAQVHKELSWVQAAHEAVRAGISTYLELLDHADANHRMRAAYLLAYFPQDGLRLCRALLPYLGRESNETVKASLILSLSTLARGNPKYLSLYESFLSTDKAPLVRLAGATALARSLRSEAPEEAVQILVEAIVSPSPTLKEKYAASPWADGDVVADAGMTLTWLGKQKAAPALPALIAALGSIDPLSALDLTHLLLYLSFGRKQENLTLQALTDEQRTVLQAIADSDKAWTINGNLSEILRSFGIPNWRDKLQSFLAA